jgi:hypothetical protein
MLREDVPEAAGGGGAWGQEEPRGWTIWFSDSTAPTAALRVIWMPIMDANDPYDAL